MPVVMRRCTASRAQEYACCVVHIAICGLSGCTIFSRLSHKGHILRGGGGGTAYETCVLIFFTTFVCNISHS